MSNDTTVSMTFANKVTGLTKLEKYENRLKSLKKTMESMPDSIVTDTNPTDEASKSTDKVAKATTKVNAATELFNGTLKKTKSLMKIAFSSVSLVVFRKALTNVFNNMQSYIDASATYVENLNLMQVAFKETGEEADRFNESFVNGLSDIFGLDESAMTRQLGFYRQLGNALDIDSDKADLLSRNLLKMQLDMSSLYNLSFEKSGEVLQSSLAGQTKPVRGATGADITQSSLQTTLDDLGIDRAVSDLSRGEKVLTIYLSLVDQLSESQGDLAKTINSVANQEKIFTEQTSRLSRYIGNVLSASVGKALPYLNAFLMVINELIERFAVFVGFEIQTNEESGGYDLSDYLDDVSDSADNASKKLSGLRSFDKLNVISTPTSTSSASVTDGIDQRLLDALEEYDLKLSDMNNKATEIRDTIMEWLGFTKEVNAETGEITWKYDTIDKKAIEIAEEVGTNLANALNDVTKDIKWEEYGENLASGINNVLTFVNSFVYNYDWFSLGQGFATGINTAIEKINWTEVGRFFVAKFKIAISTLSGFLQTLNYEKIGQSIGEFINGAMENFPSKDLAKGINALGNGIFKALKEVVSTIDWGEVLKQAFIFMGNLGWEGWAILLFPSALKMFTKLFTTVMGTDSVLGGITKLVFPDLAKALNLGGAITDTATLSSSLGTIANMGLIAVSVAVIVSCAGKIISDLDQLKEETLYHTGEEQKEARQVEMDVIVNYVHEGIKSGDIYENFDSYLDTLKDKTTQLGVNMSATLDQFSGTNAVANTLNGTLKEWAQKIDQINDEYEKTNTSLKDIVDNTELTNEEAYQLYRVLEDQRDNLREQKKELVEGSDRWNDTSNLIKETNSMMDSLSEKYDISSGKAEHVAEVQENIKTKVSDTIDKWEKVGSKISEITSGILSKFKSETEEVSQTDVAGPFDSLEESVGNAYDAVKGKLSNAIQGLKDKLNEKTTLEVDANTTNAKDKITDLFTGMSEGINSFSGSLGLKKITTSFKNLFKFADGGLPPVGQLFVANEKGPELVGQLGGQSFVANQKQMMDLLDSKIGSSKQPINLTIPIQVGSKEIGKAVLSDLQDMASANGKPITIG